MPTEDGFNPDDFLPPLLADEPLLANEPERQETANEADQQLLLKASILVAIAAAISIAISSVGNRVTLFADVTASVVDKPTLQPGTDKPTVLPTADAKASLPPTEKDAPSRDELAAATEPAGRNQPEGSAPSSEALFREFQAWAAEKDAQAKFQPVQQPVQDAAAKADSRASLRLAQRDRHVRPVHNARAQDQSTQNPFLRIFGSRN